MNQPTLYLHIGATKTGSTALQRFMEQNFSRLLELGVLYPNFHDADIDSPMRPGVNYWHGIQFETRDSSTDLQLFNRCIEYCRQHSLNSVVISHEALLVNWHKRLGQLTGKLDAKIKIICYVRRQDHHLESAWKQHGHKFFSSRELLVSLNRNEWGGWRQTDWYKLIAPWAECFGRENIIIRPYEKEQMPGGIFPDFLRAINLVWPEEPRLTGSASVNSGFSRDVLEYLYLNKDFYRDAADQRLHIMMDRLLTGDFKKKPFETYGILSPKEQLEILDRYEASNQALAREFLGREDGRLFYEPWPRPEDTWKPYEGLTVERMIPIITTMIYSIHKQQQARIDALNDAVAAASAPSLLQWLRQSPLLRPVKKLYHRMRGPKKGG